MSTAQLVLAILGSASVAGVLGAVVTGLFNRRRLGAEATELITKAASGVVERLEGENTRLHGRVDELEEEVAELERQQASWSALVDSWARVLQLHAAWDHMAVAKLRDAGIVDLPAPPPLYPPHHAAPSRDDE